ncbi:hypothetical protein [Bacillus safensis]|nr:hypothetical protein [Bacillus safensis]MCY7495800.1 hypothetical protein [Bacillus safensis]MED4991157.1 hypothetical protein [Bacillus safensis]UDB47897.1 hypothetical protein B0X07_01635 [Bacillus safensis]
MKKDKYALSETDQQAAMALYTKMIATNDKTAIPMDFDKKDIKKHKRG